MDTGTTRTDRLSVLLEQFDKAREMAQVRLTGLGDEEYLWEPAPDCWSLRRRSEAVTPRAFGPGSGCSTSARRTSRRVSTRRWPARPPTA